MKFNPEKREQVVKLKDGRTLFKTHNGFKSFVEDKKGVVTMVTHKYYNHCKKHSVDKLQVK